MSAPAPIHAPIAGWEPDVDGEAREVMSRVARTFDLAARLLPSAVRTDVRRLYLVMRTLDDAVDHADPAADHRIAAVEDWARGGPPIGPEAALLEELVAAHPTLPRDAVLDFCAGMRADLEGATPVSGEELDRYCYQVAGTVGRLMAVVLGVERGREAEADAAARALGCAMQRTNILRDLVEDGEAGRCYLPARDLAAVGVEPADGPAALADLPSWPAARRRTLLAMHVERADADYAAGMTGIRLLRAGRRAVTAAARMYREILREVEADAYGGSGRRVVVSRRRKAVILARSLAEPG